VKILDFLSAETVTIDLVARDKRSAITEMVQLLKKANKVKDSADAIDILLQREQLGSTGIGQGVAIPHARCSSVGAQVAALAISRQGIDFESLDGEPVHIFFLLLCPGESNGQHLQAMARISRLLKDKHLRSALRAAKSAGEVIALIKKEDENIALPGQWAPGSMA
jgi:PTS system nitrogen regulatory IIA component